MHEESTTHDLMGLSRRLVEAVNRRDVDALMSFFAPEAVWDALGPGDERLRGPTAIRGMLEDWFRPYEDYEVELEELLDLGEGVVFAVAVSNARLLDSRASVQWRQGFVTLYDGALIVRISSHNDTEEALVAAERLAEERG
jgi:ketosteroid isomerase-like protein